MVVSGSEDWQCPDLGGLGTFGDIWGHLGTLGDTHSSSWFTGLAGVALESLGTLWGQGDISRGGTSWPRHPEI